MWEQGRAEDRTGVRAEHRSGVREDPWGQVEDHLDGLRAWVAAVEPESLSPQSAAHLLDLASAIERVGTGLKLLVAPRALNAASWREEGYRSAAAWLAETTRSSVAEAVSVIKTAERLEALPATTEALRRSTLSATEAKVLASAATASPDSEEELLDAATSLPMGEFTPYARALSHAARENDPSHRTELRRQRYLRWWTDTDGLFRLSGGLLPEDGVDLVCGLRARAAHMADEARRAKVPEEAPEAYAADALVSLANGETRRATFAGPEGHCPSRRATVMLHVSLEALRRGQIEAGEFCEIPGVGPVPLKVAEGLLGEAMLKLAVEGGVDVTTMVHLGRSVPAHVRSALEARDRSCVVPECSVSLGLEIDHWKVPFAEGGASELGNLARLCRMHHRMKTYDGYVLSGGPGKWEWRPPD